MNGWKQVITIILSAVAVSVGMYTLYVQQRAEFQIVMAAEREARRVSDIEFRRKINDLRDYFTNLLLDVAKDTDERRREVEVRVNERLDRYDRRMDRVVNMLLDAQERVLVIENTCQEVIH